MFFLLYKKCRKRCNFFFQMLFFSIIIHLVELLSLAPKKIVLGVHNIFKGNQQSIELGNLRVVGDCRWAYRFLETFRLTLIVDSPTYAVLSIGQFFRLYDFASEIFLQLSLYLYLYFIIKSNFIRRIDLVAFYRYPNDMLDAFGCSVQACVPENTYNFVR